tara:strand:- start:999 stop:1169 length:171 start_codon:yes stop_codon:yes gene_type:complete
MGGKGSSSGALPQKVTAGDELAARPSPRPRRAIAALFYRAASFHARLFDFVGGPIF